MASFQEPLLKKEDAAGKVDSLEAVRNKKKKGSFAQLTSVLRKESRDKEVLGVLCEASSKDANAVLDSLQTNKAGLSEREVEARLLRYGPNLLSFDKPARWYSLLYTAAVHPFNVILVVLAVISVADEDFATFGIMVTMVTVSIVLRFWQEMKSVVEATALKSMVSTTCVVIRREDDASEGLDQVIDQSQVVPGDILRLTAGVVFPGDVRLLDCKDLFVSQSTLTGEFMPVSKQGALVEEASVPALERRNVCFMGTNVVSGTGTAVVLSTGDNTYMATIAELLAKKAPLNAFQIGVQRVSYLLVGFMLAMVPFVIAINGLTTGDWKEAALFGISVAVGLTPEMLPMIVNANLARGAMAMARKKNIVKRLDAIQNLGAMDVLCTDKTGTLTLDHVVLMKYEDAAGRKSASVLELAWLNSFFQTGLKNLLDHAIMDYADTALGADMQITRQEYTKVDELPFDFVRRRMSVILTRKPRADVHHLICKGALEELLEVCAWVREGEDGLAPMTPERKARLQATADGMNEEGLRVLGLATKEIIRGSGVSSGEFTVADEVDLVFCGFLMFLDPPKDSAAQAIREFAEKGVAVKVLTGDNLPVARKICQEVGIPTEYCVTGPELEGLTEEQLSEVAERTTIFAKLTPIQKLDIVMALKSNSHTVGFLGDGINDALALRGADVGISVDSGTSIAKDAADVILLQKNLLVLNYGVYRGRITHGNTIKYIKMAVAANFGNVFSILVASAWLPFLPMSPTQILTNNLLYDISQISIPWDHMDVEYTKQPRAWSAQGLGIFMVVVGPTSCIFDLTTFLLLWYNYGANSVETQNLFQTGWFVESLLTQTLIVHMIRTSKIPLFQRDSIASLPVLLLTFIIMAIGVAIPYTPLGRAEGLVFLPASFYYWLAATVIAYCLLTQIVKMIYIRIFKSWL